MPNGKIRIRKPPGPSRPPTRPPLPSRSPEEISYLRRCGYDVADEVGSPTTMIPVADPSGKPVQLPTAIAALVEEARAAGLFPRGPMTGTASVAGPDGRAHTVPAWVASLVEQLHRSKGAEADSRRSAAAYVAGTTDGADDPVLKYLAGQGYR